MPQASNELRTLMKDWFGSEKYEKQLKQAREQADQLTSKLMELGDQ